MKQPSEQEMIILSLLWQKGNLSARQVLENMPDDKERAYTSILSVMQAMEKKKLINHEKEGKTNLYFPLVQQEDLVPNFLSKVVRNLFGGQRTQLLQNLFTDEKLSSEEIDELQRLIDQQKKK